MGKQKQGIFPAFIRAARTTLPRAGLHSVGRPHRLTAAVINRQSTVRRSDVVPGTGPQRVSEDHHRGQQRCREPIMVIFKETVPFPFLASRNTRPCDGLSVSQAASDTESASQATEVQRCFWRLAHAEGLPHAKQVHDAIVMPRSPVASWIFERSGETERNRNSIR